MWMCKVGCGMQIYWRWVAEVDILGSKIIFLLLVAIMFHLCSTFGSIKASRASNGRPMSPFQHISWDNGVSSCMTPKSSRRLSAMALAMVGASPPTPTLLCQLTFHPTASPSLSSGFGGASMVCSVCNSQFGGHLKKCVVSCGKQTHELCGAEVQHKFHCNAGENYASWPGFQVAVVVERRKPCNLHPHQGWSSVHERCAYIVCAVIVNLSNRLPSQPPTNRGTRANCERKQTVHVVLIAICRIAIS